MMMTKHVVIQGPVDHDGARYEEGAEISLPEDAAAALVAVGVLQVIEEAAKARKPAAGDVH